MPKATKSNPARRARFIEALHAGGHLDISAREAGEEDCMRVICEGLADALLHDNEPRNAVMRNRALDLIIDGVELWRKQ